MTETIWTPEKQDELRLKVREIIAAEGMKQTQIAAETGIPYGTFTAWLGGTYKGVTEDKAASVSRWLSSRAEKAALAQQMPSAPTFQPTKSAERFIALMQYCQNAPDLGVIAGGAGIGKTTAIAEYRRRAPNVFMITAQPVMTSATNLLYELTQSLDLPEGTPAKMSRAIVRKLRGMNALVIIDEAQHLPTTALNQARTIHDLSGCGLVFVGNETVYSRMGDGRAEFAQLFSRVGMKVSQARPRDEDVAMLVAAWGVDMAPSLPLAIARKPGALRGLTKAMRMAHMMAGAKGEAVTAAHLKAAWSQIGFDPIDGV